MEARVLYQNGCHPTEPLVLSKEVVVEVPESFAPPLEYIMVPALHVVRILRSVSQQRPDLARIVTRGGLVPWR